MLSTDIQEQFLAKLGAYRDLSLKTLIDFIPDREPKKYLYDLVTLYPKRGGKGFRPGLCLAACNIFGGTTAEAMNSAIALELFHNAFLVHDDIEDESDDRRGSPTMHAAHGVPIAINVGDAMNVLSIRPLMHNIFTLGPSLTWQVFSEIEHMVLESVEGQAMELGWRQDNLCDLKEDDYLRMILKKTCWYTCIHPLRIGAIIGSGGAMDPDVFNRFGYYLGAAFQIQDDLLNLVGDQDKYGKEICGDVLEGKRTLMLIYLLNTCNQKEKQKLETYLAKKRSLRMPDETEWVMKMMKKYDCIAYGRKNAQNLAGAALKEFYTVFGHMPESEDKQFIESMILYMINRDY
ncbi:polyprenyl synthetase family protein [Chitinophaga barathri]|uniref:Polyprenyl synthetase family protein n=1 Tax=Chitinophaga barathri TaxID=1647451 RepID=A0A3N4M539_9BACT|nr:polyprenyl synthetase family protein [Chitinophaga barathri]RPD38314.1 polyprenyl synthetase family protein [Chitinophaga barathri]